MGSLRNRTDYLVSFPFHWFMSGFVYLGIQIARMFHQMFKANFNPLLDAIKKGLHRWAPLPLSLLGRIFIIKMNVLPRLLYPCRWSLHLYQARYRSYLMAGLVILFDRKERLNMLSDQKGVYIRWYQQASQLRFIADWDEGDPASEAPLHCTIDIFGFHSIFPSVTIIYARCVENSINLI